METNLLSIHWLYLFFIGLIVIAMIMKRDVVLPSLVGLFLIGWIYTGSLVGASQSLFNGLLTAGEDLFDIMLIIALMVAMLKSMEDLGADKIMVAPAKGLMSNPNIAFWILGIIMYFAAIFFWPTPATALVGTILIPLAVKSGLPAISAAMAINILGHGMALSGDWVIQGAPGLAERTIGLAEGSLLPYVVPLSLITGGVASIIAFFIMRKDIKDPKYKASIIEAQQAETESQEVLDKNPLGKAFAILIPLIFSIAIITMVMQEIRGGGSTALIGGIGTLFLLAATIVQFGSAALEKIVEYLRHGFLFSIKIFSPIIPIAAFFFLGSSNCPAILGEGAPSLLFDLGQALANALPLNGFFLAFGNLIVGIVTGLDGSGFSGLPMVASLAQGLGAPAGINVHALAAVGQMGAVWSGGGCLAAWSFGLVATAGIAGISPLELARKNFFPVVTGLLVSTIVAIVLWM